MNTNMNHAIELTRWPAAVLPFRAWSARIVAALVRTVPLLTVCVLPILGLRWSLQRENATRMAIHQRMKAEASAYQKKAAARSDLLRGLVPGRLFRQPQWRDVEGGRLPIGHGAPALVLFVDRSLGNPLVREARQLAVQCPRSEIVLVAFDKASVVREYARAVSGSRLHFVADPRERWHEWYGATRRRAFVVDGRGVISRIMADPTDVSRTRFSSVLKQIGG